MTTATQAARINRYRLRGSSLTVNAKLVGSKYRVGLDGYKQTTVDRQNFEACYVKQAT